jgi:hypothetical protein
MTTKMRHCNWRSHSARVLQLMGTWAIRSPNHASSASTIFRPFLPLRGRLITTPTFPMYLQVHNSNARRSSRWPDDVRSASSLKTRLPGPVQTSFSPKKGYSKTYTAPPKENVFWHVSLPTPPPSNFTPGVPLSLHSLLSPFN